MVRNESCCDDYDQSSQRNWSSGRSNHGDLLFSSPVCYCLINTDSVTLRKTDFGNFLGKERILVTAVKQHSIFLPSVYIMFPTTTAAHRRSFCDKLCQLYDVIYKTRCPTLFHTEHHQSSFTVKWQFQIRCKYI